MFEIGKKYDVRLLSREGGIGDYNKGEYLNDVLFEGVDMFVNETWFIFSEKIYRTKKTYKIRANQIAYIMEIEKYEES